MADKNEIRELDKQELEKVTGGTAAKPTGKDKGGKGDPIPLPEIDD